MLRSKPLLRTPDTRARLSVPVFKPKRCKQCKERFTPVRQMQLVCGGACGIAYAQAQAAKKSRRERAEEKRADRAKRESLKTRSDYIKEAQAAVNRYCRLRDYSQGRGCITCGKPVDMSKDADAGHWLGRGAYPEKRFNTFNIALQCVYDNRYLGGLPLKFRDALIERYGLELVEKVEVHQPAQKWSIEYLQRLKRVFAKKARRMERKIDAMQG